MGDKDFNAPEEAYAMAYNDGHRDGRNKTGYDPSVVKLDRQTFRDAYKLRAESTIYGRPPKRMMIPYNPKLVERFGKHKLRKGPKPSETKTVSEWYLRQGYKPKGKRAESFESVTDEWLINRKRSNPLSIHYIPQKASEDWDPTGAETKDMLDKCDNERSFLIEILSDRQLDEFLEFEEDSYSAEETFESPVSCKICGKTFASFRGLNGHMNAHLPSHRKRAEEDSCYVCKKEVSVGSPETGECDKCKAFFHYPDCDKGAGFADDPMSWFCSFCYDDIVLDRYHAETKLGKDSCCCGATKTNPCACMIQGVMDCNATCPCSLAKSAEEFDSAGHRNWGIENESTGRAKCKVCGQAILEGQKSVIAYGSGYGRKQIHSDPADCSQIRNAESDTEWNCVLCGHKSTGYGHNPEPVASFHSGRCCDTCNATVVIPARLRGSFRAEEGSSCPVCGTYTEVIREYFDDDTSWVDLVVCDNCYWMEELDGNEDEYEEYMEEMLALQDEEPDADLLEKPNVVVDTSWDWSDGVGPPPSQQTLDITYDAEGEASSKHEWVGGEVQIYRYDHDAAGYPTIGIPDPRGRREWFCIKCGADALSDVEPTDHDCPGYQPSDDEPNTGTCPHCKGKITEVQESSHYSCPECGENLGENDGYWEEHPMGDDPSSFPNNLLAAEADVIGKCPECGEEYRVYGCSNQACGYVSPWNKEPYLSHYKIENQHHDIRNWGYGMAVDSFTDRRDWPTQEAAIKAMQEWAAQEAMFWHHAILENWDEELEFSFVEDPTLGSPQDYPNNRVFLLTIEGPEGAISLEDFKDQYTMQGNKEDRHYDGLTYMFEVRKPYGQEIEHLLEAEGEELTDEEKQEGWNQFQEEAASIEDPDLEQIKTLADKYLLDVIDDETPEFFVDPGLEDYYQFILTDPTYPEGGEPEDEEAAAMFEELKHVRYWATILTDQHLEQADTAAKAMMAAGIMGDDKELFDQGRLGLETNNQVQRERELIAQWLAEGGVHEN